MEFIIDDRIKPVEELHCLPAPVQVLNDSLENVGIRHHNLVIRRISVHELE
jgi:hypothetical protein